MPHTEPIIPLRTDELSQRDSTILCAIIQSYILSATPVGSQNLAHQLERQMKLSSATIRNVMARLESDGYVTHPHTSAGRIPTDKGYRLYVDSLMDIPSIVNNEIREIHNNLSIAPKENILRSASQILGSVSNILGVVQLPNVAHLVIRKLELIALSSTAILVVVAFDSDTIRTMTLEAHFEVNHKELDEVARAINEIASGRTLQFLREHFPMLINDTLASTSSPIIRMFVDSMENIFALPAEQKFLMAGTQKLLQQPEFDSPERIRGVIELIENEDVIIHVLEPAISSQHSNNNGISVIIGAEHEKEEFHDFSVVSANYTIGSLRCSVGVIGPKRMDYTRMISLVSTVATALSTQNGLRQKK